MGFKTYRSGDDLKEFGFNLLTGEACGIGMRILTDLTEEGCAIWREFTRSEAAADNWNSGGVKSIMLPRSILEDLWLFCHIRANKAQAIFRGGFVNKADWTETALDGEIYKHPSEKWYRKDAQNWVVEDERDWLEIKGHVECGIFHIAKFYKQSTAPGTGIDNQHAFSGRVE